MAKNPNILVIRDGNNELIIGPRHAFVGQDEFDFIESLDEVLSMLKSVIDQPGEIDQLRTACDRWHIDDSRTTCLSDIGLKQLVAEACVSRQLGAVYLEDMSTEWQSQIVSIEKYRDQKAKRKEKDGSSGANKEKPKVPDELSERFLEVFDRMFEKEHAGEFAEKAKDVLKGDLINRTISMVMSRKFLMSGKGAKLVARLVGRSFFAVATMIWTAYSRGREIGQAIAEIVEAVGITREAKKDEDLSAAAKLMAKGLSTLGAELLDALLGKIAPSVKPVKQKKENSIVATDSQKQDNGKNASTKNISKKPPKFLKARSNDKEPGALKMTPEKLKEINRGERVKTQQVITSRNGYPKMSPQDHASFARRPEAVEIKGPRKIYRIVGDESNPNGSYWSFDPPPKTEAEWRRGSAVTNKMNGDGGYVVHEIPEGATVKAWTGPIRAQKSADGTHMLPGGKTQIFVDYESLSPGEIKPTPWTKP